MKKEYYVIIMTSAEALGERVSAYLEAGWVCQGGVHTLTRTHGAVTHSDGEKLFWAQAVTRG